MMISYDDLLKIYDKCMTVYENDLIEHCVSGDDLVTDFHLDGEHKILRELKRLILDVKNEGNISG